MIRSCLALAVSLFYLAPLQAQAPDQKKATIAYLHKLQTKDGGFKAATEPPSTSRAYLPSLRATSSAIRTLHYLKGDLPNKDGVIKFVADCYDKSSGGFKDHPQGKAPEISTTAVGIMAVVELGMPLDNYKEGVVKFLAENAKSFEEIRIAAAALESLKMKGPKDQAWLVEINKLWNADGTSGKGEAQARATGGLAVTLLRLGAKLPDEKAVIKTIVEGQKPSGGYGQGEAGAELETTYRVMRALHMLKQQPENVEALRAFVLRCRNSDHGYGIAPGEPSSASGTYFATIISYWLPKE